MEIIPELFWGHDLVDSIAEVRTVDVFMGFHGAGFVNSFYLQPVRRPWLVILYMDLTEKLFGTCICFARGKYAHASLGIESVLMQTERVGQLLCSTVIDGS